MACAEQKLGFLPLCCYVPPEYVKNGIYSTEYDVYSFGVLLLQIISGKRNSNIYGCTENLNRHEYVIF
ncbi:hypothetical protein HRI_004778400 [Hibiscus trionum]|uniref:Serine-threonine/tyrosine-protein kinase catalytic domain-containing protein n=1 Tax=Hibiscus trionum TaxID=183268 RepID=A0A9W7J9Z9_HIBTR|nr:hypothetical protein HRI_004778400 [Hibiscus trionum]